VAGTVKKMSKRAVYVGTTRVDNDDGHLNAAPVGTIGLATIPGNAQVVGLYEASGRLYVEWVRDV
jgi:hypothetical protein